MPLYMGVHNMEVGVSAAELFKAHQARPATQEGHGVDFQHCWVSERAGKAFCLVEAPDPNVANTVHLGASGFVAGESFEVVEPTLQSADSDKLVDQDPRVLGLAPSPPQPHPPGVLERHVSRTVERPFASISSAIENPATFTDGRVVPVAGIGKMVFDSTFQRLESGGMPMLHTRARLVGRGPRVCRSTRIEVELTPWSTRATEIRIRPQSPFVHLWGVRRSRRYWMLAHGAANALKETLLTSCAESCP
jgi:hypothetical protein